MLAWLAIGHGRAGRLWKVVSRPTAEEWTEYMRRWSGLQHVGKHTLIMTSTSFSDPEFVWIGDNVVFSDCAILGHDASIVVLNRAFGESLDAVGRTIIRDNVFIGLGAVIMPDVEIGPTAIVAAGAVVTRDVPENAIVAGMPARVIGTVSDLVQRRREETRELPWFPLLQQRGISGYDARLELELRRMRIAHFFGDGV